MTTNVQNFRPISLLLPLCKLLTRIIIIRVTTKLDEYQPVEQMSNYKQSRRQRNNNTVTSSALRRLLEKC